MNAAAAGTADTAPTFGTTVVAAQVYSVGTAVNLAVSTLDLHGRRHGRQRARHRRGHADLEHHRHAAAGTDTAPTFGAVTISPQTFTIGTAVDLTLPVATGGEGAIVYALTPAAPAGLTFIPATRVLSGTPNTQASATTYTYTAGDTDGSTAGTDEATLTFTIAVNAAAATVPTFGDATIGDLTYAIGTAVDLTLPVATGSDTLFYSVRGATLPDGLTFNTGTRVLSGMPTTAGFTMHSYRVANVFARAVALMFTITITDPDAPDTAPAFAAARPSPRRPSRWARRLT